MNDKTSTPRPRETIRLLYDHELANAPGKSIVGLEVTFAPNGATPPHRHAGATVVALVSQGAVLSSMNGNPPKMYHAGESFVEMPGCHHTVFENASQTLQANLTVVFVVDTAVVMEGYEGLVVLDDE